MIDINKNDTFWSFKELIAAIMRESGHIVNVVRPEVPPEGRPDRKKPEDVFAVRTATHTFYCESDLNRHENPIHIRVDAVDTNQ